MEISDAILATLSFYDGFEYPLTAFEVYRFLINPLRLRPHLKSFPSIQLKEIQERLEELSRRGAIIQESGFYSLKDRKGWSEVRIEREKIAAQKWRLCRRLAWCFQAVPWIRGLFVSGSLAMGTVDPESDFDILVLAGPGRMYLARLFLSGMASLMGARRKRDDAKAPDKFCFNHYLTTDELTIRHESLYNAQTYAHLVPLMISPTLAGEFFVSNLWINKYVYNFTPHQEVTRRMVKESRTLKSIARSLEAIMNPLAETLERWAKNYQQQRIVSNPATHAPGGRVVYTSKELEFHPHSFEKIILEHYNSFTRKLSIALNSEPDSGLKV